MKTEKEKMLTGELYDASDAELSREREQCRDICQLLSSTHENETEKREELFAELFGEKTNVFIQLPFFCDYGTNIDLGKNVFFNFNCVVLDVAQVKIGDNVLFGPAVQIYTATHPLDAAERRTGLEAGKPITIGSDVWVGGGSIICPGVSIGDRAVIGAGSVVTRDVPSDVIVAGNPARTIRKLPAVSATDQSS